MAEHTKNLIPRMVEHTENLFPRMIEHTCCHKTRRRKVLMVTKLAVKSLHVKYVWKHIQFIIRLITYERYIYSTVQYTYQIMGLPLSLLLY